MKEIKEIAAQGDVMFVRVETLPEGLEKKTPSDSGYIAAHSETGHHHIATGADSHHVAGDGMLSYLVARGPIDVKHHRTWDTHETLRLLGDDQGGEVVWEIRRQREHVPEGWRRVED